MPPFPLPRCWRSIHAFSQVTYIQLPPFKKFHYVPHIQHHRHSTSLTEYRNSSAGLALCSFHLGIRAGYSAFVQGVVDKSNRRVQGKLDVERPYLRSLPQAAVPEYTTWRTKVKKWSTIRVTNKTYSVPSRLCGHEVKVHQYADYLEVYYKDHMVERLERVRGEHKSRIDYRHIIWSLVRKPGAFARYRFREHLFPTPVFRQAYDALGRWHGGRTDVEYVRILHLAASTFGGPSGAGSLPAPFDRQII